MKKFISAFFCMFLFGNIYSAVGLQKGNGDTVFICDSKDFEQTIRYDSAGYRSSPANIYWTAYKVIDTIFMDSIAYGKIPTSLIIKALVSRDTVFGEEESREWYQREKEWFSKKHTKTTKPALFFNENEKTIFYKECISLSEKNTLWKTILLVIFFLIAVWASFHVGKDDYGIFHETSLDTPKNFVTFLFLTIFVGIVTNIFAGFPRVFLDGLEAVGEIVGYDSNFWWMRAGILSASFFVGYIFSYFLKKKKKKLEQEKRDSMPAGTAGSE